MTLANLSLHEILGFTVVAAVITTTGTLLGLVLKERFFTRSFEAWKTRQTLNAVRRKYRDPIALAAVELLARLAEISSEWPADFLHASVLDAEVVAQTRSVARDLHYNQYKLLSSIYRLCAFLGWVELYRQDLVFLDDAPPSKVGLDARVQDIRRDLSDGELNEEPDWSTWCDVLLFREEQRAIGESMIVPGPTGRTIMGYAEFYEAFSKTSDAKRSRWFHRAAEFLLDPEPEKDFRVIRIKRLFYHLVDLVESLEPTRLLQSDLALRDAYRPMLATPVSVDPSSPSLGDPRA